MLPVQIIQDMTSFFFVESFVSSCFRGCTCGERGGPSKLGPYSRIARISEPPTVTTAAMITRPAAKLCVASFTAPSR